MLHFICGPPGSGKTTLAKELQKPGDLIFDFDCIALALGAPDDNSRGDYIGIIESMRDAVIRKAESYPGTIFVILGDPKRAMALACRYAGDVTTLDVPAGECVRRLIEDQRPGIDRRIDAVKSWWRRYERR